MAVVTGMAPNDLMDTPLVVLLRMANRIREAQENNARRP